MLASRFDLTAYSRLRDRENFLCAALIPELGRSYGPMAPISMPTFSTPPLRGNRSALPGRVAARASCFRAIGAVAYCNPPGILGLGTRPFGEERRGGTNSAATADFELLTELLAMSERSAVAPLFLGEIERPPRA